VWDELVGMKNRVISKYQHDERIPVDVASPEHPIVQGITPWTIVDETYVMHDPGPDSLVLLTTDHPACMHSLAWTRMVRNARVFCYQSGHDHQAYADPNFMTVLSNGIHWAASTSPY
jgi:type 1 glutamine amidotransferase